MQYAHEYDLLTLVYWMKKSDIRRIVPSTGSGEVFEGMIIGIEKEDGSGKNWNLKMLLDNGKYQSVFVRTM